MKAPLQRWLLTVAALGMVLAGLVDVHSTPALHAELPAAGWFFPAARHAGDAPHAEAAGVPERAECQACLQRLQTGGAVLRAAAAAHPDLTARDLQTAASDAVVVRRLVPGSSRAPPIF